MSESEHNHDTKDTKDGRDAGTTPAVTTGGVTPSFGKSALALLEAANRGGAADC
jgi:hypothetical protein